MSKIYKFSFYFVSVCSIICMFILLNPFNNSLPYQFIVLLSIDVLSLVFCNLLLFSLWKDYSTSKKRNIYLYMFLMSLTVSLLIDFVLNTSTRLPVPDLLFIGEEMAFSTTVILAYFFWRYIKGSVDDQSAILIKTDRYIKVIGVISILIILANFNYPFLFYVSSENVISYTSYTWIAYLLPFMIIVLLLFSVNKTTIDRGVKQRILVYSLIPSVISIITMNSPYNSFIYLGFICSTLLIYINIHLQKGLQLLARNEELLKKEAEMNEYRNKIMISQIQPHFIYNTLGSISMLYKIDPAKAAEATDHFAKYLRTNIDTINQHESITFKKELEHIQNYIYLEQMRFDDLEIDMSHIECDDFIVPSLSIQPIVENAIKHGFMGKESGSKVFIKEIETPLEHIIKIQDNGIGYQRKEIETKFTGLNNSKYRLKEMVNGDLKIISVKDQGTLVTITIPKTTQL